MTKEYRMTPDGRFIYPWPIVKGEKFLIACPGERAAHYLILLFERALLASPPDFEHELHSDGATPIYQIPNNGPIAAFLPKRQSDPQAAAAIEKVLSKALWNYVKSDTPDQSLAVAARRRFDAQLSCSSCQGLGVGEEIVGDFVESALKL